MSGAGYVLSHSENAGAGEAAAQRTAAFGATSPLAAVATKDQNPPSRAIPWPRQQNRRVGRQAEIQGGDGMP